MAAPRLGSAGRVPAGRAQASGSGRNRVSFGGASFGGASFGMATLSGAPDPPGLARAEPAEPRAVAATTELAPARLANASVPLRRALAGSS